MSVKNRTFAEDAAVGIGQAEYKPHVPVEYQPTSFDAAAPVFTLTQFIKQLRTQWSGADEGETRHWAGSGAIVYAVDINKGSANGEHNYPIDMTPRMEAFAVEAFELWDDLIARSLTQTTTAASASITFDYAGATVNGGTYSQPYLQGVGASVYDGRDNNILVRDDIWLNSGWTSHDTDADIAYGNYSVLTYIHEIGHSLGLSHPGSYNAAPGVSITYNANAEFAQDTRGFTVMSYFEADEDGSGTDHYGQFGDWNYASTPLLYDIAAIQAIYGADMTTRAGDTVYGFNSTADRAMYNFATNSDPVLAIWDGGGNDTLDVSGFGTSQYIDLNAGTFSNVGYMTKNVAIAFGAVIENAVGGSGSDTLVGNQAANTLNGGGGTDTAVIAGIQSQYFFGGVAANFFSAAAGIFDTFLNIEFVKFLGSGLTVASADLLLPPTLGDDYADTIFDKSSPMGSLALATPELGSVENAGDTDIFAISLTAGSTYTFDLAGTKDIGGHTFDPSLRLLNASGAQLAANGDLGGATNSQITYAATVGGTFYLEAKGADSGATGSYLLNATKMPVLVDDYRDSISDLTSPLGTLALGTAKAGTIETVGDKDMFSVSLVSGRTYVFDAQGDGLSDPNLRLLNASGTQLAVNNDFGGSQDSKIVFTATSGGTFYLEASGAIGDAGTYTVKATQAPTDDFRDSLSDRASPLGTLALGTAKAGSIETPGDTDLFSLSLVAGRTYTFDLDGTSLGDAHLRLLNASGAQLAINNDFGGSTDSRIVYTATANGTVYLEAKDNTGLGTGAYTLKATQAPVIVDDYRDSLADRTSPLGTLVFGTAKTGSIETAGDADLFSVRLTAGRTYTFDLDGTTLGDSYLRLLSSSGAQLAVNDDFGGLDSRIVYTATSSGTFYLEASEAFDTGTGAYSIKATQAPIVFDDYRDSLADRASPLGTLVLGTAKAGSIETDADADLFSVRLMAGQTYIFDLKGNTLGDPYLRLLNASGAQVAFNDDSGGADSQIVYKATASGTFYLEANSFWANETGTYTIKAAAAPDDYRDSVSDRTAPLGTLALGVAKAGLIELGGDTDLFSVRLVSGQTYTFDLTGNGLNDPSLRLLTASGAQLAVNNDFGGSLNSKIVYTATSSGTFYLEAKGVIPTETGAYSIKATQAPTDDYRDSIADRTSPLGTLVLGTAKAGVIETAGDADLFSISLVSGQAYTFALDSNSLVDGQLRLLGASGTQLALHNGIGADAELIYTATTSGLFYLEAKGGSVVETGSYAIKAILSLPDPAPQLDGEGSLVGQAAEPNDVVVW